MISEIPLIEDDDIYDHEDDNASQSSLEDLAILEEDIPQGME